MIVVDTSVLIDFLRGTVTPGTERLPQRDYEHTSRRFDPYGRWPHSFAWSDRLAPAIRQARDGFALPAGEARPIEREG